MNITGIFHIHSAYSYDSEFSLSRIKKVLVSRGCGFGVICDHQIDFDGERYDELKDECKQLCEPELIFIPGLEFEFESLHILGVGLRGYCKPEGIGECLENIKSLKGLAVWAHPSLKNLDAMKKYLDMLDGVEVWSARYGTKYAPSVRLCDLVSRQRREGKNLLAYAGQDAHREDQIKDLYIEMEVDSLNEENILQRLSIGSFNSVFHSFRLSSTGQVTLWQRVLFPFLYNGYRLAEKVIDSV